MGVGTWGRFLIDEKEAGRKRHPSSLLWMLCCWLRAWNIYTCKESQHREEARAKRSRGRLPGSWHSCALPIILVGTSRDCLSSRVMLFLKLAPKESILTTILLPMSQVRKLNLEGMCIIDFNSDSKWPFRAVSGIPCGPSAQDIIGQTLA